MSASVLHAGCLLGTHVPMCPVGGFVNALTYAEAINESNLTSMFPAGNRRANPAHTMCLHDVQGLSSQTGVQRHSFMSFGPAAA